MSKWEMAVFNQKYRAQRQGLSDHFTLNQLLDLIEKTGCKCAMCKKGKDECTLSVDHIIPLSRGGNNTIDNIQILCTLCNSIKSDKATGIDIPPSKRGHRVTGCNSYPSNLSIPFTEEDWHVLNSLCAMYGGMDKTNMVRQALRHVLKTKPKFVLSPTDSTKKEEQ